MANAGRSKIEMVEGMKVLHVDMFEASRGPAHKPGPGGLVLGKEQLEKILASDAETVEYDGCNITTGICDPGLELDPKTMLLQQSGRVSQTQHHYAPWLVAAFLALSILMLLVWRYAPRQPHGVSKPKQQRQGKQGKKHKAIRTPAEEKKDK